MRQVIHRFLKHLEAEKNASPTTVATYQYDLDKFHAYLVTNVGNRLLPGDIVADNIRDYPLGYRSSAMRNPMARLLVLAPSRPSDRFSNIRIGPDF